ncbi:MAG: hypothetical protein K2J38_05300 [Muribaculaceae bacterium]|nr:hypothetical protein [Muribaculaceae bacterium]
MLNATVKTIIAAAAAVLGVSACADKAAQGAAELYAQTEQALSERNYSGAITLLDTLNSRYPKQTEVRRNALQLRARAIEGLTTDSIEAVSRRLAEATLVVQQLQPGFKYIKSTTGLDGYYIPSSASGNVMTGTMIQPRITEKGYFYIVANVQGRAIGLTSLDFIDGASSISSSAISAVRVVKVEGSESASFNQEDLVGIGQWILDHPQASKVILRGTKGDVTVRLDAKLRSQLADCYRYASALQAQRLETVKREKFERMLATARDQIANLPNPDADRK